MKTISKCQSTVHAFDSLNLKCGDFPLKPEFYAFQAKKFKRKIVVSKQDNSERYKLKYAKIACRIQMFASQGRFYKIVLAKVQHEIELMNAFKCNNTTEKNSLDIELLTFLLLKD